MNKNEVRSIIESVLASGSKTPGIFDLPKMLSLKTQLEACSSISDVINLLEEHRGNVLKIFGLEETLFQDAIEKLKNLA
ncbi:hypothetical protein LIN78_14555 [Leeia sp. TBRC 13508]|uniref:Uncharacterized protein n=1 Tax=Leeia speluncae TaxID=2884804 RepID=A0ABS8D9G5_9NEIS|nr:hypothetical protein [Leeia speluncae]MCB6184767.1 hypothetical protein [Leeia speluncae]